MYEQRTAMSCTKRYLNIVCKHDGLASRKSTSQLGR